MLGIRAARRLVSTVFAFTPTASYAAWSQPPIELRGGNSCIGPLVGGSVEEIGRQHAARTSAVSGTPCSSACTNQATFDGLGESPNTYYTRSVCTGSRFLQVVEEVPSSKDGGGMCPVIGNPATRTSISRAT